MEQPTMAELEAANPMFFSDGFGELGKYHDIRISQEGSQMVLLLHTFGDTFPVYTIDPVSFELEFLRHGWIPEGRLQ